MKKVLYILGQLSDEDIDWMTRSGKRRRVDAGEHLILEGQPISAMYILIEGSLEVSNKNIGVLAKLGIGEIVGEMSFIDRAPPSATVTALDNCLVLQLEKADLEQKLDSAPEFRARFYRALAVFLADRLRTTEHHLGYGSGEQSDIHSDEMIEDELDMSVLDTVSVAGERFDRMLKTLAGGTGRHQA